MFKIGDKVKITNAEKIEGNQGYFANGDITEITTYKGHLALKHNAKELDGGLLIYPREEHFLEKIQ